MVITEKAISELAFASESKLVFARNHPYDTVFHLPVHFQRKGFARRLLLKQKHKVTQNWPITVTTALYISKPEVI